MANYAELVAAHALTLVDFTATWCGPCKALAPVLEQVKQELGDEIRIVKIDIDQHQPLAGQLQVSGVPTLILYKNGQQVWRQSGALSLPQLRAIIGKYG